MSYSINNNNNNTHINNNHNHNNIHNSLNDAGEINNNNTHNNVNNNNNKSRGHTRNGSDNSVISSTSQLDEPFCENQNLRNSQKLSPGILSKITNLKNASTEDIKKGVNGGEGITKKISFNKSDGSSLSHSQSSMDSSYYSNNNRSPNHQSMTFSPHSPYHTSSRRQSIDTPPSPLITNSNNNNNNGTTRPLKHIASRSSPSISSNDLLSQDNEDDLQEPIVGEPPIVTNKLPKLELPSKSSLRSSNNAVDSSAAPSSSRQPYSQQSNEVPSSCSPPSNLNSGNSLLSGKIMIDEKDEIYLNGSATKLISFSNQHQQPVSVNIYENGGGSPASSSSIYDDQNTIDVPLNRERRLTTVMKLFDNAEIKEAESIVLPIHQHNPLRDSSENDTDDGLNNNNSKPQQKVKGIKQPKPDEEEELSISSKQIRRQTINYSETSLANALNEIKNTNSWGGNGDNGDNGEIVVGGGGRGRAFSDAFRNTEATEGEQNTCVDSNVYVTEEDMDNMQIDQDQFNQPPPLPKPVNESLTPKQILIIFSGLMVSLFLSSLDMTIVATALPAIVSDLQGLEQLPWVVTIYLLTSTSVSPLFGKFSDIFGKKILLLSSLIVFLIGSLLCAVATTMNMLILARAIQGLGGGGLMSAVMIVMAEIVPLRDRGKYQGLLGAVYAVSSVVGPLMGGTFTDNISWRWAFWINLPLGAVAFIVVFFALKIPQTVVPWREGIKKIDVVGSLSLVAATISFLLALSWGGVDYPWQSPIIICLFIGTALFVALFIVNEKYWFKKHPIIPLELFKTRNYVLCSAGSFLLGFVMFGVIYYIPLYFQYVRGASATASGLQLLPTMLGIVLFGAISGLLITKFGHYKSYPIIGMAFMMIGIYLLSLWDHNSTQSHFIGYQCFIGVGIGLTMQILVLIVQNSVNVIYISISTATVSFFRTIGGVVSVSVFSAILNQQFANNLTSLLEKDAFVLGGLPVHNYNIENIRHIENPIYKAQIIDAYQSALSIVFLSAAPFAGLGCILILFVKNEKLRTTMITQKDKDQEMLKKGISKIQKERENESDSIDMHEVIEGYEDINNNKNNNINEIDNNSNNNGDYIGEDNNNVNHNTNTTNDIELDIRK